MDIFTKVQRHIDDLNRGWGTVSNGKCHLSDEKRRKIRAKRKHKKHAR